MDIFYITNYALTNGIMKVSGTIDSSSGEGLSYKWHGHTQYIYGKNQWHSSINAAKARAEEMRKKKIASLKKQIEKLEKLEIKVVSG